MTAPTIAAPSDAPTEPATDPRDRLIVALDKPDAVTAEAIVDRLGETVSFYKIGLGMLTGGGLALAMALKDRGKRVFLDMKLYDIGNTVESAVRGLAQFDLDFLTVHGDPQVVEAAVRGRGDSAMRILGVTVLTSLDRGDLDRMMIQPGALEGIAVERARRAFDAGADGVIASPHEAPVIRALPGAQGRLIVTPGVRPQGAAVNDQKRVMTPADAILGGADHVVVGRPVVDATDPMQVARGIQSTLQAL